MSDIYLDWGQDFQLTLDGDLALATGWDETRQAAIRLALTNQSNLEASGIYTPADYVWDVTYGLGLRSFVGEPFDAQTEQQMKDLTASACLKQPAISGVAPPIVTVTSDAGILDTFSISTTVTLQVGETQNIQVGAP